MLAYTVNYFSKYTYIYIYRQINVADSSVAVIQLRSPLLTFWSLNCSTSTNRFFLGKSAANITTGWNTRQILVLWFELLWVLRQRTLAPSDGKGRRVVLYWIRHFEGTFPLVLQGRLIYCTLTIKPVLMDPCIVDYSVEIPTRCSFVIEFIIPKFVEGSTCYERHTAHHQELETVFAVSGLYAHMVTGRSLPSLSGKCVSHSTLTTTSHHVCIHQRLQIQFRAPGDERCTTRNMSSLQKTLE